jgi:hypothetical protein
MTACHVNLLVSILCAKEISQERLVGVGAKSGQIHHFAIDFDRLGGVGPKCVDQFCIQERQTWQFDTFVKKQNDMPRCSQHRQAAGD